MYKRLLPNCILAVIAAGLLMMAVPAAAQIPLNTVTANGTVPGTAITYTITDVGGAARNIYGNFTTDNNVFSSTMGLPEFVSAGGAETLTVTLSAPLAVSRIIFGVNSFTPPAGPATAVVVLTGGTATTADFNLSDSLVVLGGNSGGAATYTPATGTITATVRDQGLVLNSTSSNTITGFTITTSASGDAFTLFGGFTAPTATAPTFTKVFGAASVGVGGSTTLTFSLGNTSAVAVTGLAFTDTLPAGLVISTPNGLTSDCGGTTTATAGSNSLVLANGTLAGNATCTIGVSVTATAIGPVVNTTSVLSSTNAPDGPAATAPLAVLMPPTLTKTFGAANLDINGITALTFTVGNPNATPVTGIAFTDTLPAGLLLAPSGLINNNCAGSTVTAPAGANLITFSGGTLAAASTCTITVNVTGTAAGPLTNTTSAVASANAGTGLTATAPLVVLPVIAAQGEYQLRYFANLDKADSFINATNAGTFSGIDPNGRICANFYGYDPREEPISCCSCLITPNGLVSLSVRNDVINNTLTGAPLTAGITVKVLASLPTPVGGTVCNPSAPVAGTLVRGLKLWGTTPHLNTNTTAPNPPGTPIAPAYQLTETEFARSELSLDELAKLTGFCRFIQVAASGFGQCRSCPTVGAQGAAIR